MLTREHRSCPSRSVDDKRQGRHGIGRGARGPLNETAGEEALQPEKKTFEILVNCVNFRETLRLCRKRLICTGDGCWVNRLRERPLHAKDYNI